MCTQAQLSMTDSNKSNMRSKHHDETHLCRTHITALEVCTGHKLLSRDFCENTTKVDTQEMEREAAAAFSSTDVEVTGQSAHLKKRPSALGHECGDLRRPASSQHQIRAHLIQSGGC
jgi:hypothetical protein